jgi:hypothetical protein
MYVKIFSLTLLLSVVNIGSSNASIISGTQCEKIEKTKKVIVAHDPVEKLMSCVVRITEANHTDRFDDTPLKQSSFSYKNLAACKHALQLCQKSVCKRIAPDQYRNTLDNSDYYSDDEMQVDAHTACNLDTYKKARSVVIQFNRTIGL